MSNIAYFNGYIQMTDTQSGLSASDKLELLKAIAKRHDVEEIFDTYDCNDSGCIEVGSAEDHYYEENEWLGFFADAAPYIETAEISFEYGEESGCFWKFEFKDGQFYVSQGSIVFEKAESPTDLSAYKSDPDDLPVR